MANSGKNAVAEAHRDEPGEASAQELTQELVEEVIRKVTTGSFPAVREPHGEAPPGKKDALSRVGFQVGGTFIPLSLIAVFFGGPLGLVTWDTLQRIWKGPEEVNQIRLEQCQDKQADIAFYAAVGKKLEIEDAELPRLPKRCKKILSAADDEE